MAGHGIILPEQTDASAIPGLSDLTKSNAMADTGNMATPPMYYPLQPSGRQKSSESVSILSRVKRLNRTGSSEQSDGRCSSQQVASAKRTHEDTLHSSGSPLQKLTFPETNPDLLFVKSPKNPAVIMQQQERQKRMQQQQRRHQDRVQQQDQQQQQQQQQDTVFQYPNLPSNMNKMLSQQDQSLH